MGTVLTSSVFKVLKGERFSGDVSTIALSSTIYAETVHRTRGGHLQLHGIRLVCMTVLWASEQTSESFVARKETNV